mgnify:CR=1 FL=1
MPQKQTKQNSLPEREWTYRVSGEDVTNSPKTLKISASDKQKADVADRVGVDKIDELSADLELSRYDGGHIVKIQGELKALIHQKCVVSLETIETEVSETFDAYYINPNDAVSFSAASKKIKQKKDLEEAPILEEWEDPEYMEEGTIDLGELVVQYLCLGMSPFPQSEETVFEEGDEGEELRQPSDLRKNPFAALQYWNEESEDP